MKYNQRYFNFFNEIKNIALSLEWSNESSFIGGTNKEIDEYEKVRGVKFGENWRLYLNLFGYRFDIKSMPLYYGFGNIDRAYLTELEENYDLDDTEEKIDWIKEIKNKLSWQEKQNLASFKNNSIILINTLLEGGVVQYSNVKDEELKICNFDVDQNELGICTPFTTIFRRSFYFKLLYKNEIKDKFRNTIPWLQYYYALRVKFPNSHIPRSEFYTIAHKKELKENRIMGIDEFEVEFIKYLIEEKGFKNMPEIFNPYTPLITFQEYLNV